MQAGDTVIGECLVKALDGPRTATSPDPKRRRVHTPLSDAHMHTLGLVSHAAPTPQCAPGPDTLLLLRVYPLRLRNETTTRFLDWWTRKGAALEQADGGPAPVSTPRRDPLVPQHILETVAKLHGGTSAPPTAAADEALAWSSRAMYVEVPSTATVEWVLRSLPEAYGIVEFVELELWPKDAFATAERRGRAQLIPLGAYRPPVADARKEHANAKSASHTEAGSASDPSEGGVPEEQATLQEGAPPEVVPSSETRAVPSAVPTAPPSVSEPAAPLLVAYSSSESDTE